VWKIVLATNHLPDIKNFDGAIRRRLLIVPTAETVPENHRVPYLKQVLAQEEHAKAILAWAIRGDSGLVRGIGPEHEGPDEAEHRFSGSRGRETGHRPIPAG
jgi:hypothetical protein